MSVARWLIAVSLLLACALPMPARALIHVAKNGPVFRLDGAQVSYVFGVNGAGQLQAIYFGPKLAAADAFAAPPAPKKSDAIDGDLSKVPQEYAGWGEGLYYKPGVKVTFDDGNRDLALRYASYSIHGEVLSVVLKDIQRPIEVTLDYEIDPGTGIVRRRATVANKTNAPVTVEEASAATYFLPHADGYTLRYLSGRWASEDHVNERPVQPGKTVLESRRGSTGMQNEPWFAIRAKDADEEHGQVWFGALAWSGSWQIAVEQDQADRVRVTGGFNPFDFGYRLAPGQTLASPDFYAGVSSEGMGGASRLLHRLELTKILPQAPHPKPRPVLYNSWEATFFDVNEAGQMALAEKAAQVGVERFVMDDGWFGARNSDKAGLGDWTVNPQKFPHGLKPLIDRVHALHMDFGLWVEPEMVNPDSDLYRAHPDWVLHMTGRPRTVGRNQMVLNLAREDVHDYVLNALDKLLRENDIAFLKWDYNRSWSEPGWPAVAPDQQKKVHVDFVRNVYSIMAELRRRHPALEIESCSSGGGRVDLGVMRYTDEVWPSDNTDAYDRLRIQDGFTQAYTPGVMMAWVTDSPSGMNKRITSLAYRFLSSMQGSLGIGADVTKWNADEIATAHRMVDAYKTIRTTVQQGKLYRLVSPRDGGPAAATESVSEDGHQAVLFAFLHSSSDLEPYPVLRLRGLDPAARYRVRMIEGKVADGTPQEASGAYWMNVGIQLPMRGDFQAAAAVFERR